MEKRDKTSLEGAIQDEARRVIEDLAVKEALELKRLEEAYASELEDFKNRTGARMEAKIRQECLRLENRAGLNQKKFKLKNIEAFVSRVLEEALKGIRDNPRYKTFLLGRVVETTAGIPEGAEVRLKSEDLVLEKEIRKALKGASVREDISFVEDKTIKWGGCIVVDPHKGRIFDSSMDRIYFQKSDAIRREVMKMLDDYNGKQE